MFWSLRISALWNFQTLLWEEGGGGGGGKMYFLGQSYWHSPTRGCTLYIWICRLSHVCHTRLATYLKSCWKSCCCIHCLRLSKPQLSPMKLFNLVVKSQHLNFFYPSWLLCNLLFCTSVIQNVTAIFCFCKFQILRDQGGLIRFSQINLRLVNYLNPLSCM